MPAKYFTGQSVHKWVSACPATTFRELVETCIHTPIPLAISQDDFHRLPEPDQKKYKTDHLALLTPAAFKTDNARRKTEFATVCNLIFLDIDVDKKTGLCPAAAYVKNPQILRDQLAPLAFVAYHTITSTEEKPRIRIMVSANAIPLSMYPAAVATIAQRIGLTIITPESEVAVQPMFLPVLFAGQHIDEHPTFCGELIGEELQPKQVADVEMDEIMGVAPKGYTQGQQHGEDALAFLRPPVPEITLEIAREALSHIDPDIEMLPWIAMASALKHQFSHKHAAEAFEIFDEWSAKGTKKYLGRDDTLTKWNCIQPTPLGRVPVTIRSLIHAAVDAGYNAGPVKEVSFASVLSWIREDGRTFTDLTTISLQKIMAAVMLSLTEEEALLNAVARQAKKLKLDIGISVLRKDLRRLKLLSAVKDGDKDSTEMPGWLKGWCYVTSTNEFFHHRTTQKVKPEAFNNMHGRKSMPAEDDDNPDPAAKAKPVMLPQDFALNLHKIQCVSGYRYTPSEPGKIYTKKEGLWYVNTYRANFPTPTPEGADEARAIIDKHMELLIADPEHRRILFDWMAYNVQFPGQKIRWAPLFQGGEGCGKTFFYELMRTVLGAGHAKLVNKASISGSWNEWATGAQVVAIEEIRVVGENKYEIMNKLKELITNNNVPINQRNTDTRTVENTTNYIAFTNFHDALALAHNDRRYFVLKAILQEEEEIRAVGEQYFDDLFALLEERGGALRWIFENHTMSEDFNPNGRAPHTIFRDQVIEDTSDEVTSVIRRLVEDGEQVLVNNEFIVAKTLRAMFDLEELRQHPSDQYLGQVLRNLGYHSAKRVMLDSVKQTIWVRNGKLKNVNDIGGYIRQKMDDQKKIADIW